MFAIRKDVVSALRDLANALENSYNENEPLFYQVNVMDTKEVVEFYFESSLDEDREQIEPMDLSNEDKSKFLNAVSDAFNEFDYSEENDWVVNFVSSNTDNKWEPETDLTEMFYKDGE